jgi:hypothetical protein
MDARPAPAFDESGRESTSTLGGSAHCREANTEEDFEDSAPEPCTSVSPGPLLRSGSARVGPRSTPRATRPPAMPRAARTTAADTQARFGDAARAGSGLHAVYPSERADAARRSPAAAAAPTGRLRIRSRVASGSDSASDAGTRIRTEDR